MKKLSNSPQKGFADWFPTEFKIRKYIFDIWREVCEGYNYKEYLPPLLESSEIYKAKSGEDVGGKELMICIDRAGRELAIRPEMTPSITRMVSRIYSSETKPIRYFSIANFTRNQKPQRGRNREFWQLNYDIFGENSTSADIEIMQIGLDVMLKFKPPKNSFTLFVNNRKLIDKISQQGQISKEQKTEVFRILDKWGKFPKKELIKRLKVLGLGNSQIVYLEKLMDTKDQKSFEKNFNDLLSSEGYKEIATSLNRLGDYGYGDLITFNPSVVRGFDYYDGLVFEVFDNNPQNNRSLFGGGRYNGLAKLFGEADFPAVGCGIGDETLKLFLEGCDLLPVALNENTVFVPRLQETEDTKYKKISCLLREIGFKVEDTLNQTNIMPALRYANKKNFDWLVLMAEDEIKKSEITIKNLKTGKQTTIKFGNLASYFKKNKV